jgi:hypothetical protein
LRYKLPIDDNFFLIFSQRGKINNIFGALTPYSFHLNLKTELLPFTFKKTKQHSGVSAVVSIDFVSAFNLFCMIQAKTIAMLEHQ